MMKNNFIFTPDKSDEYSMHTYACVGNNGNPGVFEYAKGFALAANFLIKVSIAKNGCLFAPDYAVYPICFNMRHSIELFIKSYVQFVNDLANLRKIKKTSSTIIMKAHDINNIWAYLTDNYKILDKRLVNKAKIIVPYIECFGNIDATGQTFRYPYDTENRKHLTSQSVINIEHLGKYFNELEALLVSFYDYHELIVNEYKLNSYTKKLSRNDLSIISKILPNVNEWKKDSFKEIKDNIKKEYDISSNELSKAINIIKTHYEFGYFIGTVPELIDFNEDEFFLFIDKWRQLHDLDYIYNKSDNPIIESISIGSNMNEDDNITTLSMILKKGSERTIKINEISNELINNIKVETITNIHTLFYFSRECNYSEEYRLTYLYHEKDCRKDIKDSIEHILRKTILLPEVVISLLRLNQKKIALTLIEKYGLKNYIKEQLEKRKIKISIILE
ncbi:hypothetical protein RCS94_03160 [Orbaceae bacterium ac157xtp]